MRVLLAKAPIDGPGLDDAAATARRAIGHLEHTVGAWVESFSWTAVGEQAAPTPFRAWPMLTRGKDRGEW